MTAFASLSALARALFALWALLLCLVNIGSAVLASVRRRFRFAVLALLLFLPVYFLWQVIFDLSLSHRGGTAVPLSVALGGVPLLAWLLAFVLLTAASAVLFLRNLRFDRTFLTPGTIKIFLDGLPCGVCCWQESGWVLFSNVCMNRLCAAVTDGPLLNGNQFREAVSAGILTLNGTVWRFSCREMVLDGERLQEMIASDVTVEYAKTLTLERDRAELARLNEQLRSYYLSIDEVVSRQEVLQAKVNIHDEINRLMLSTTAADAGDEEELDRVFSLWEQNALLLCMEAGSDRDTRAIDSLERLAAALRLRLVWQGELPKALPERQRSLFFSAAQEVMANAVKHAAAMTVTLSFDESETALCCRFSNDGKAPFGPVSFTGGLRNLSLLAEQQGASVSVSAENGFTLSLCFPKHQPNG